MKKSTERRLAAAERRLEKESTGISIVHIDGGLPGPVRCASAGGLHWPRSTGEPMEVFENRTISAARVARASTIVFGGMCLCAWKDEVSFQAYLNGPDFSLVPQEEIG